MHNHWFITVRIYSTNIINIAPIYGRVRLKSLYFLFLDTITEFQKDENRKWNKRWGPKQLLQTIFLKWAQTHKWNNYHFGINFIWFNFTTATTHICKSVFFLQHEIPKGLKCYQGRVIFCTQLEVRIIQFIGGRVERGRRWLPMQLETNTFILVCIFQMST